MRVLICTDRIGALSSAEAGAALGQAFLAARPDTQVAVVAMGATGADLADALGALGDPGVVVWSPGPGEPVIGVDTTSTSADLGRALAAALASGPRRVVVDLSGLACHDGGAGLLGALGATADVPLDQGAAGLQGLSALDLSAARALLGDTELVGVVRPDQLADLLLGLRGVTARRAHASGSTDFTAMLATDKALGGLAGALGVPDAPGVGAAGGAALAIVALGGWLTSGPAVVAEAAGLERTASAADVVVTGCDLLDGVARGGAVVREVAAIASRVERPCVVAAAQVAVSSRELRTLDLETAHEVGDVATAAQLTAGAQGLATSWVW